MTIDLEPFAPVVSTPVGHRILDAASQLFYDHGITATGVDLIVEQAGTTKRTLYQRFGSKDALVAAYLQDRAHRWQAELLADLPGNDPATALDTIYDHAARWSRQSGRGCAFVNAWAELAGASHQALTVIRAEKDWMRDLFAHITKTDTAMAATLHMLYEGAQIARAIQEDHLALDIARQHSHNLLADRTWLEVSCPGGFGHQV